MGKTVNPNINRKVREMIYENILTVDEAAKQRGYKVYDCALPQPWVDAVNKAGFDPRAHFVWLYDESKIFGSPAPITEEGDKLITLTKLMKG